MLRKGQRYRTVRDVGVGLLIHFRAPFTDGARATLRAGEVFTIALDPPALATAAQCNPERYEALEKELVPEEVRTDQKYSGYSLVIDFESVERDCELVS
jgi:hypothetical protein